MKIIQTAGRDALGDFAPKFAHLNDDVLFGEVWSGDELPLKVRSIITISALVSKGLIDASFNNHLIAAKKNGVSKTEIAEILTHLAFYAGWPNAWAAFRIVKEVYADDDRAEIHGGMFGLGKPNTAFAKYFIGNSYLKPLTEPKSKLLMANVTFEPKCRNNWHIHKAEQGGGQILLCVKAAKVGIKNGTSPHRNCTKATSLRFPQALSIGTVRQATVGFRISPSKFRA